MRLAQRVLSWLLQTADLSQTLAEARTHQQVDEELGEAVAEAEPHDEEVQLTWDVLAPPLAVVLDEAYHGEGQPRDQKERTDDEADVVVPGTLREVLVHFLKKQNKTEN